MPRTLTIARPTPALQIMGAAMLFAAALTTQVWGEDAGAITISHGYTNFGDLKYPADFAHLDYVNPDAPKGGEISFASTGTFDSFNRFTRKGTASLVGGFFYESLMTGTMDDPYGMYCYLCTTVEYPESRDWAVFNLRDDVRFSDGTPMTAEDVKFTFDLMMEQGLPEYRNVVSGYVSEVEVLDPYKVKFTFTDDAPRRETVRFAGGTSVMSKAWFEKTGARIDESTLIPFMGTGAYVMDSYDINRQVVLKRNPDYWGADNPFNVGGNNFDTIRVEYFADSNAAFEGFKSGEYTFQNENSSKQWATGYDFPALEKGWVVKQKIPHESIGYAQAFVFDLRKEKWQDPRVREAVRLMFNFEWSNETLFYGLYERVNSFWENSVLEATGTPSDGEIALLQPLVDEGLLDASILTDPVVMAPESGTRQLDRQNLRKATLLLDDAGWIVGDDGLRYKNGRRLSLDILQVSPAFDRIVNPYVQNLKRLGIDATLERVDYAQYVDRLRTSDYDLVNHGFRMGFEPDTGLRQWYGSETADDSSRNLMGLKNPAVDRLLTTVVNAEEKDQMITATHALDRVLRANGFWVPQWFKSVNTVAYYDMLKHPENMPKYQGGFPNYVGQLSFWWYDQDRAEQLRAAGAFQ